MGQDKRFYTDYDYNYPYKERNAEIKEQLERLSTFFAMQDSMGNSHSYHAAEREQSTSGLLSFFGRLGGYNVYNVLRANAKLLIENKKMAALVIKFSIILANFFGISLFFYWLMIDFAGIKVFLTSVGVLAYGGMKLYEKYLDIKKKKRENDTEEEAFKLKQKKN